MAANGQKPVGKNKKKLLATGENDPSKKTKTAICPICNGAIKEVQQAIFCEGNCKQWIHRQCASLPVDTYKKAGESQQPFYCLHCTVSLQKQEIDMLKEQVKSLSDTLKVLLPNSTTVNNNTTSNVN